MATVTAMEMATETEMATAEPQAVVPAQAAPHLPITPARQHPRRQAATPVPLHRAMVTVTATEMAVATATVISIITVGMTTTGTMIGTTMTTLITMNSVNTAEEEKQNAETAVIVPVEKDIVTTAAD